MLKAKARPVNPELFLDTELFDLEVKCGLPVRLTYNNLLTLCDREGRFHWRPKTIRIRVLPFDEINFPDVLQALVDGGWIIKYIVSGEAYGQVVNWKRDVTSINGRERNSSIPAPPASMTSHNL